MNRLDLPDPLDEARTAISRRILFVATAVFGVAALLLATGPFPIPFRPAMVASFALAALLSWLATRWRGDAAQGAVIGVNVVALGLVALYAVLSGLGLNAPAIGFMTLLPMVICAAVGTRTGVITAAVSVASLLALAWAEQRGLIAGASLLPALGLERRLVNHLLLVGAGLACGVMVAHVLLMHRRASDEREARFVGLLGIAVDTYWELDAALKALTLWRRGKDNRFVRLEQQLPAPWDQPGSQFEATELAAHKADLAAHRAVSQPAHAVGHARWPRSPPPCQRRAALRCAGPLCRLLGRDAKHHGGCADAGGDARQRAALSPPLRPVTDGAGDPSRLAWWPMPMWQRWRCSATPI